MKTLHVTLQPSRLLAVMLFVIHGAAIAALALSAMPAWVKTALILLLALNLFHQSRRHALLREAESVVEFSLAENGILLGQRDGRQIAGKLLGNSMVISHLCVMNVLPQGARFSRSIVILPDNLDAEIFRRLRVKLRWGVTQPEPSAGLG